MQEKSLSKFAEMRKKWLMDNSLGNYKLKEDEEFSNDLGLILCKTCHKPIRRLTFKEEIGKDVYVLIDNGTCDCKIKENINSEEKKKSENMKIIQNTDMYLRAVGQKFRYITFDKLDHSLMDEAYKKRATMIEMWCKEYKLGNKGFSLIGDVGLGKTTLTGCTRNYLIDNGYSCMMATTSQIVDDILSRVDSESFSFNTYKITDVLIIDDIGADFDGKNEKRASLYNDILFDIINYRYTNNKTVCYTSNVSRDKMKESGVDNRILDRFKEMISYEIFMAGESLRSRV